jgi:hypothetical protein
MIGEMNNFFSFFFLSFFLFFVENPYSCLKGSLEISVFWTGCRLDKIIAKEIKKKIFSVHKISCSGSGPFETSVSV